MDEPLSNLDAKLRVGMRAELSALHARLGTTTIYVTHDQVEAMTLGQRVAVMRDGRIQQVDTPQGLYRLPQNLFVAAFIGSPAMNLVEATLDGSTSSSPASASPLPARAPKVPPTAASSSGSGRRLRGRGVRRPVAAGDRRRGGGDRGARLGHPRDLHASTRRASTARSCARRAQEEEELTLGGDRAVFNARVDARSARAPGRRRCGSRSTRRASTSSIPSQARTSRSGCDPGRAGRKLRRVRSQGPLASDGGTPRRREAPSGASLCFHSMSSDWLRDQGVRGPCGSREMLWTTSPVSFSFASRATSACETTPTRRSSSPVTARRRT